MPLRTIIIAICAIALSGCIPEQYDYYLPSAPAGELVTTHGTCNDVKDAISFDDPALPWVHMNLRASQPNERSAYFSISIFKSPERPDVGLFEGKASADAKWKAFDSLWQQPIQVSFAEDHITVVAADGQRTPYHLEFPGGQPTSFALVGDYGYGFAVKRRTGDSFVVEMPDITFDGAKLVVPPIRFSPVSVATMSGINC